MIEKLAVKEKIKKIMSQLNIPYYYVIASKGDSDILSFGKIDGKDATGNEKLYMFSCTKPLTVFCGLKLIKENKLSFLDRAGKYLPIINSAYIINNKGEKEVVGDRITIEQLFTMTAGFSYNHQELLKKMKNDKTLSTLEVIEKICQIPLISYPGEKFNYSYCHDILAGIIEKVSGKKFSEVVNENIVNPLQLDNTAFDDSSKLKFVPLCQYKDGEIKKIPLENDIVFSKNWESGGAGLISTAKDYHKFAKALANGGKSYNGTSICDYKIIELMTKERISNLSIKNSFTCVQGSDYGYSYGLRTRLKETEWGLPVGEFGWDGAAGSYVLVDVKNKIAVFIAMHLREWPEIFMGKHLEIVEIIYKSLMEK